MLKYSCLHLGNMHILIPLSTYLSLNAFKFYIQFSISLVEHLKNATKNSAFFVTVFRHRVVYKFINKLAKENIKIDIIFTQLKI